MSPSRSPWYRISELHYFQQQLSVPAKNRQKPPETKYPKVKPYFPVKIQDGHHAKRSNDHIDFNNSLGRNWSRNELLVMTIRLVTFSSQ